VTNALESAPEGSPLAGLRDRIRAKQQRTTVDLEMPGAFEDVLAIRCKPLLTHEVDKISEKYSGQAGATEQRSMDVLILACDRFLTREGEKWVPLEDDGKPVRFDAKLAESLGIPDGANAQGTPDTHAICRGVFAAAAGALSDPPEGVSADEHEENARIRADHLIASQMLLDMAWLKGGADVGAEELLGE
jgi:hypothetical protein